jgi:hypothetical protein
MGNGRHPRYAEWLMIRQTGTLSDLVDEAMFADLCGVTVGSIRQWRQRKWVYGIDVPEPVFRPDGHKPVWMKSEVLDFARAYKAKKATRGKQ